VVDKRLPRRDDALVLALACGTTVEAAARQAGVSDRTVYRRLADVGFQRRVKQARSDVVRRSAGLLSAASGEAVRTLRALMKDSAPLATRLGAVVTRRGSTPGAGRAGGGGETESAVVADAGGGTPPGGRVGEGGRRPGPAVQRARLAVTPEWVCSPIVNAHRQRGYYRHPGREPPGVFAFLVCLLGVRESERVGKGLECFGGGPGPSRMDARWDVRSGSLGEFTTSLVDV
jgi:hypothetical protein